MKGVVLAAGDGGRLRPLTLNTPKVLLKLGGRTLIHYSLDALSSAGISDIAVVVGHNSEKVLDALKKTHPFLTYIYNQDYAGENAISVYSARFFVENEPFVACMGDHPISPQIVECLLTNDCDSCVLCVDSQAWHTSQLNDGTRVQVNPDGYIGSIGKSLNVWNAIDTGVFKMTSDFFSTVECLMEKQGIDVSITDVVRHMGSIGKPFATCDVSGMFWADVDTFEDYQSIDSLLREKHGQRI